MKANLNVLNHIQTHDRVVALALLGGIGNFALSNLISASQAEVYRQIAAENNPDDPTPGLDQRAASDEHLSDEREPPVGLEPRETPMDRVRRYGPLYANVVEIATGLEGDQYDLPQTIEAHVQWRMGMPARDVERVKRGSVSTEEALRLVTAAKSQQKFWRERAPDVIAIATDATTDQYEASLLELQGVDAVQAMIRGYGKLIDRIGFRKGSPYFTAKNTIGDELRSEVGAMEAAKKVVADFIGELEKAYIKEIMAAINAGRALATLESQEEAIVVRQRERLQRLMDEVEAAEKTDAKKDEATTA